MSYVIFSISTPDLESINTKSNVFSLVILFGFQFTITLKAPSSLVPSKTYDSDETDVLLVRVLLLFESLWAKDECIKAYASINMVILARNTWTATILNFTIIRVYDFI